MSTTTMRILCAMMALFALTACGGGGGSSNTGAVNRAEASQLYESNLPGHRWLANSNWRSPGGFAGVEIRRAVALDDLGRDINYIAFRPPTGARSGAFSGVYDGRFEAVAMYDSRVDSGRARVSISSSETSTATASFVGEIVNERFSAMSLFREPSGTVYFGEGFSGSLSSLRIDSNAQRFVVGLPYESGRGRGVTGFFFSDELFYGAFGAARQ